MPEAHRSSHPTSETNQDGSRAAAPFLRIGHARCLSHKTHLRVMKFQISRTFFFIESRLRKSAKKWPQLREKKLGPRRRSNTDRLNTTNECCMLCVRVSFDTTICLSTTRTPCRY